MHPSDTPACFRAHMGLYAIEPTWLQQAVYAVQCGLWPVQALPGVLMQAFQQEAQEGRLPAEAATMPMERRDGQLFARVDDIAVIRIVDQMTKMPSKFGGTSTVLTRKAIRQAVESEDIRSLLLAIDSPGGMVAGTMELADEVARAVTLKPVAAHIEDMGASAAYWVASQAQRLTATRLSQVGSIGVFAEVIDSSGAAAREGLVVHVRSTGPFKGLGAPGTPIPPALLDEIDGLVAGIGAEFFAAVRRGRHVSAAKMEAVTTGQVWLAPQAQALGLLDGIESFEQALEAAGRMRQTRRDRAEDDHDTAIVARQTRLNEAFNLEGSARATSTG